jgi:hypothetical protein
MNISKYSKAIVAALTAVGIGLQTQYPASHWQETVTAAIGTFLVWFVPNTPKGGSTP